MRTINSIDLIVIKKHEDPAAFAEWAEFYQRNGCFRNMNAAVKQMNVLAVFSPWPPTNPAELAQFEDRWLSWQLSQARAKDEFTYERIKRKCALPDRPYYAPHRQNSKVAS
jgi:hypothetical protein